MKTTLSPQFTSPIRLLNDLSKLIVPRKSERPTKPLHNVRICLCLLLCMLGYEPFSLAQLYPNILPASFEENLQEDTVLQRISIPVCSYFINTEYFHIVSPGYTHTGSFAAPYWERKFATDLRLRLGIFVSFFNEDKKKTKIEPIIRLSFKPSANFSLILGQINGNRYHELPQAVLNDELTFTNYQENGMQFLFTYPHHHHEIWINWMQHIQYFDSIQEFFMAGTSNRFNLPMADGSDLNISAGMTLSHQGGQINFANKHHIQTVWNGYTTLQWLSAPFSTQEAQIELTANLLTYANPAPTPITSFKLAGGAEQIARLHAGKHIFSLAGYYAPHYYTWHGDSYYNSVSYDSKQDSTYRGFVWGSWDFTLVLGSSFRLKAYTKAFYNIDQQGLDYSYGMYIEGSPSAIWRNKREKFNF